MSAFPIAVAFLGAGLVVLLTTRDRLDPAFVYPMSWGVCVLGTAMATPYGYFQITLSAAMIFLIAAGAFLTGCLIIPRTSRRWQQSPALQVDFLSLARWCFLLHCVAMPFVAHDVQRIVGNAQDVFQVAFQLRIKSVTGDDSVGFFVGNYLTAGMIILPLFVVGLVQKKLSGQLVTLLALPWLALNLLIGGRGGLVAVILASLYVYLAFGGRFRLKVMATFGCILVATLVAGNLLVGKIDATLEDGVRDVAWQSIKGFFDYFFAGPILFSRYLEDPGQFTPTWDALIFVCHVLEKVGFCVVPSIHQEFLPFNREGDIGNVYSIVFSIYPKYGYLGLIVVMFCYGATAAFFHHHRYSSVFSLVVAGFLFYASVLSIYLDAFGPSIYFFIKVFLISLGVSVAFTKPLADSSDTGRVAA